MSRPWWWRRPGVKRKRRKLPRQAFLEGIQPPRRGKDWRIARAKAEKNFCEVCHHSFLHVALSDGSVERIHPPIDHILPEKFLHLHGISEPHHPANLICLCRSCHARKKTVEDRLFPGDKIGFLDGLRCLGWPMERVHAALAFYRLET